MHAHPACIVRARAYDLFKNKCLDIFNTVSILRYKANHFDRLITRTLVGREKEIIKCQEINFYGTDRILQPS